ncbi:MAG: tetratricopeptide repeat protein [Candidatus Limnocylindria bacterium]
MSMRPLTLRLSILALLLAGAVACQSDEAKLAEHMARGDEYAEADKKAEALIEYKSVLQIDPNHAPAHYALAKAYLRNNQPREGFWELRETVRLDPANLEARVAFAQLAILAGESEEALGQSEAVIAADPKNIAGYVMKGQSLQVLKRKDEAHQAFEKAVEVGPEDPGALRVLAMSFDNRKDFARADELYTKALAVSPDMNSYIEYGRFLTRAYKDERSQESEASFRKAIEVAKPEQLPDAYGALANFYYRRDRFEDIVKLLEEGISQHPDSVELIYLLARFHSAQGDEVKARALIEQATQAKPDDPKPYLILAAYRARLNDSDGALAAAEQALAVAPDDENSLLRKSELLVEIGFKENDTAKIAEGREIVDKVLAKEPTNPGALFIQAKVDLATKKTDDAITAIRTAINSKPNWAEAYFVLGTALASKGDHAAARNELARSLEIDANLYQAQQVLAKVHSALGEDEYAIEAARRYLAQQPGNIEMRLLIAQSFVRLGKVQEAKRELNQIEESKRGAEGNYALGRVHLALGEYKEARKYLELADAAAPNNADILTNLLTLDAYEKRLPESTTRIDAAIAANPGNAKLQQLGGVLAEMTGRPADAEVMYKKSIELDPSDLTGYERLARFYSATGRLEDTVKTYEKALEVHPEQANVHHLLGVLYDLAGKRALAQQRYEDAIRLDPKLSEAKNNLAFLFAETGQNLDRALDLAQEAKTQLPENASVADTLGWVMHKRGMHSAAISYLKESEAGTDPNDASIGVVRYHLALAYEANGEPEAAREALARALAGLEKQLQAARAKGATPSEPPWAADVRAMLDRLSAKG